MPYFLIENFRSGLDVRKSALTAPAGTLTHLENAVITPGGEIAKRKAFVKVANVAGTFGLAAIGTKLVVFTKNTTPANPGLVDTITGAKVPETVLEYHRIPNTSPTAVMTDYDVFDGKIYLVMYDSDPQPPTDAASGATLPVGIPDGATYHQQSDDTVYVWEKDKWVQWEAKKRVGLLPGRGYRDTTFRNLTEDKIYVTNYASEWDIYKPKESGGSVPLKDSSTTSTPVGKEVPAGFYSGDVFHDTATNSYYVVKAGKWATWAPDGSGPFMPSAQMEGYTVYNYNEKKAYITKNAHWEPWVPDHDVATLPTGTADGTHFRLTAQDGTHAPGVYYWQTSGWLPWKKTVKNQNPHFYFDDREKVNDKLVQNLDQTWEWTTKTNPNKDTYQPTEGAGMGYYIRAYKSKIYCVGDKYLRFSAVDNAFLWEASTDPNDTSRTGAGYVNVSFQEGGSSQLNAVEIYYEKLALMTEYSCQMWAVVSDPKQNTLGQVLRQTGTKAPWSVQQYGSGDILFLASSGIRSLKARDISNSAAVSDIGSPIDDFIRAIPANERTMCRSVLEPIVGRVWFAFRRTIAVLSFFPGPNITAWSTYTVPFDIDYITDCGDRVYVRSGDDLYLFGGADGVAYDDTEVTVILPYLDGSKPGHMKQFQAIDVTATGEWDAAISYSPDDPTAEEPIAKITGPTWDKGRYELTGYASHMSLRFHSQATGPATISNCAIHYNLATDSD